jgi:DNA-binding transcriptional MocR family regulator
MLIKIERDHPPPVYQQIIGQIKKLIDQGSLEPGSRLPPSRSLAEKLGVNRSTIYLAYAELQALGYLQSRPGSYNIVLQRMREVAYDPDRQSLIRWEKACSEEAGLIYKTFLGYAPEKISRPGSGSSIFDLASLGLDPGLYPLDDFRRCARHVLLNSGFEPLEYGSHKGYPPLCEYIAKRLRLHGISVSDQEILITNGAQQAIDLIARLLGGPGRKVAIETPSYANAIPLLRFNRLQVVGIPMKSDGLDLAALERALRQETIAFVYTMPNFQNPTGITTSHQHREKLLSLCTRCKVPIVEDGFEEDMKYYGQVALPIKSIDEHNIVIYLGTFSKALFPGLRTGWITGDKELIGRILAIKRFCDLTSNNLSQVIIHRFCTLGYYDKHLKKIHRLFRQRMLVVLKAMKNCFPPSVSWTRPMGGYTIWVRMPKKISRQRLTEITAQFGVGVSPGEFYFPQRLPCEYFRINIARVPQDKILEAVKRLGKALDRLTS